MHEAMYWIPMKDGDNEVRCLLCPHVCEIPRNGVGLCRVRKNVEGRLYTLNYGEVTAAALDPIEKKPLKNYMPGKYVFSLGTFGCNLACGFCQNWTIAHGEAPHSSFLAPEEAVVLAQELLPRGNIGIAFTYSEPLMWYEYVLDTAREAKKVGLKNILVTNGYINPKPLKELLPYIDAVNLDIKAYTEGFYNDVCKGKLSPVLTSAKLFAESCHLEVTTLIIPGLNDSPEEIRSLARWLADMNPNIPLHLSRYFPNYKFDLPPTPRQTIEKAGIIAREYLHHVYLGNI